MTRTRDRLYICGWQGARQREKDCWYDLVSNALAGYLIDCEGTDGVRVRRVESAQSKPVPVPPTKSEEQAAAPLPAWALMPAPTESARPKLAPSRIALELDESGAGPPLPEQPPLGPLALSENGRYARGLIVHALLQHLPEVEPGEQERAARAFVAARGAGLAQALRDEIVAETLAIVRMEAFAPLFRPGGLAEVPVVARIGDYDLEGQIDRLAILDGTLLILDYKTNRPPPKTIEDVAPAYIAQLAAYRMALKELFPNLPVHAALLWTDGPRLMEIPSTSLDEAERRLLRPPAQP
jgi:ATP-dependent helicase/nuclease subunit A